MHDEVQPEHFNFELEYSGTGLFQLLCYLSDVAVPLAERSFHQDDQLHHERIETHCF